LVIIMKTIVGILLILLSFTVFAKESTIRKRDGSLKTRIVINNMEAPKYCLTDRVVTV